MLQTLLIALVPSAASFAVGAVIGYGRAAARLAVMENEIANLKAAVEKLDRLITSRL